MIPTHMLTIFFLIIGQAGDVNGNGGGVVLIPSDYPSLETCEQAGELSRAHNNGLSYLSYTCVPGTRNIGDTNEAVAR